MIKRLVWWIVQSRETMRTRRQLARLDDRRLDDIGLTRCEAAAEAERPFWDHRGAGWHGWRARPLRHAAGTAYDGGRQC